MCVKSRWVFKRFEDLSSPFVNTRLQNNPAKKLLLHSHPRQCLDGRQLSVCMYMHLFVWPCVWFVAARNGRGRSVLSAICVETLTYWWEDPSFMLSWLRTLLMTTQKKLVLIQTQNSSRFHRRIWIFILSY